MDKEEVNKLIDEMLRSYGTTPIADLMAPKQQSSADKFQQWVKSQPSPGSAFSIKGRQMGKSQAIRDAAEIQRKLNEILEYRVQHQAQQTVEPPTMPSLYPSLRPFGSGYELTLPDATPSKFVLALNMACHLTELDDYRCTFPASEYNYVKDMLVAQFGKVNEPDAQLGVDPDAPMTLFIEYVGQCRSHSGDAPQRSVICKDCGGTGLRGSAPPIGMQYWSQSPCHTCNGQGRVVSTEGDSYATGWWDGGWNVRFPEAVLRAYFPEPEAAFDGDFFRALLGTSDINKRYKALARQFHPDLGGNVQMFHKLQEAYSALKDPMMRKRYEAGLKFQVAAKPDPKAVVFKVPRTCGRVTVRGKWEEVASSFSQTYYYYDKRGQSGRTPHVEPNRRRLNVTEILKWDYIVDAQGRVMVATWAGGDVGKSDRANRKREQRGERPFNVSYEHQFEVEFDVKL